MIDFFIILAVNLITIRMFYSVLKVQNMTINLGLWLSCQSHEKTADNLSHFLRNMSVDNNSIENAISSLNNLIEMSASIAKDSLKIANDVRSNLGIYILCFLNPFFGYQDFFKRGSLGRESVPSAIDRREIIAFLSNNAQRTGLYMGYTMSRNPEAVMKIEAELLNKKFDY